MRYLSSNLAALSTLEPEFAKLIAAAPDLSPHLVATDDGGHSVRLGGETGPWVQSRRGPIKEAERLAQSTELAPGQICIVLGMGMGYLADQLVKLRPLNRVAVIESSLPLLRLALGLHDFSAALRERRLIMACNTGHVRLTQLLVFAAGDFVTFGYKTVAHGYAQSPEYNALFADIAQWSKVVASEMLTTMAGTRNTLRNLCLNVPRMLAAPGVSRFAGVLKGVPGILVGAGPSLQRNIEMLKACSPNAFVLAVSTALKRVLAAGVAVDATNAVDYSHLSERYFTDIGANAPSMWTKPTVNPLVLDVWQGRLVMSSYGSLVDFFGKEVPHHGVLEGRASNVAHHGLQVLIHLGCDPIIFCGMDQAFSYHIGHVPGTAIHDQFAASVHRFNSLEMQEMVNVMGGRCRIPAGKDVHGNPIFTDKQMDGSVPMLEDLIAQGKGRRFINATEGGRRLRGTEDMPLAVVAERYLRNTPDLSAYRRILEETEVGYATTLERGLRGLERVKAYCAELGDILADAIRVLARALDSLHASGKADPIDKPLNRLNTHMTRWQQLFDVIAGYSTSDQLDRQRLKMAAKDPKLSLVERAIFEVRAELVYATALSNALTLWNQTFDAGYRRLQTTVQTGVCPAVDSQSLEGKELFRVDEDDGKAKPVVLDAYIEMPDDEEMRAAFVGDEAYSPLRLAVKALLGIERVRRVLVPWPAQEAFPLGDPRIHLVPPSQSPDNLFRREALALRRWNHAGCLRGITMATDVSTYGNARRLLEAVASDVPDFMVVIPGFSGFPTREAVDNLMQQAIATHWEQAVYLADGPIGMSPCIWECKAMYEAMKLGAATQLIFHFTEDYFGNSFARVPVAVGQLRRSFDLRTRRGRQFCAAVAQRLGARLSDPSPPGMTEVATAAQACVDAWRGELPRDVEIEVTLERPCTPRYFPPLSRARTSMPLASFRRIVEQFAPHADSVNLTIGGFGDPLSMTELEAYIAAARPHVASIAVRTFGIGLDPARIDRLHAAGMDVLNVRMGYWGRELYRDLNGVDAFEQVRGVLKAYIERQTSSSRQLPMIIPEVVKGMPGDMTLPAFRDDFWSPTSWPYVDAFPTWGGAVKDASAIRLHPGVRKSCYRLNEQMFICADGRVPICNQDFDCRRPAGDLSHQRVAEVWNSELLARMRTAHEARDWDRENPACGGCQQWFRLG